MKKIILAFIVLIGISTSCTKDFEDYNTDKKHPTEVPGNFLFANAQKVIADQVASTNVNLNIYKLFAQYWTETTYTDEANYDVVNRTIADNTFRVYYRNALVDLKDAKRVIAAEVTDGDAAAIEKENRLFIIDLLEAYCYNRLVDMFGDIPYTEALDIENISPVYDDAATIYDDLLTKVTNAVAGLNDAEGSFGANDLYFGGDVSMWKKFGNTLKVKMGITLADVDPGKAQTAVEAAYAGAFSMGELCELVYIGGSNSNPLWQDLVNSGRDDFVPTNTIVDIMNGLDDPRRPAYFTLYNDSAYVGGDYGYSNTFSQYSHIAPEIQEPTFPITLLDFTELSFYLADAANRGYSVGGSAADHYANAITSSFDYWGVDGAADYITANPFSEDNLGTQAWIAFYVRGFIGWTSWRMHDLPAMNMPPSPAESAGDNVPMRMTYPINEQTLNGTNYTNAASAVGGDLLKTKLFWDKN
ncbi:MAG: hypothetical protein B6D64_01115 [Bacteroidetes bacterium 4484_276]|nr:MAG: hypothetical protein B6D64_01115 [Bacteroidetes bacterium 4484_276]